MDMVDPVPLQDVERLRTSERATVLTVPELRTIHLFFDQVRDELLYSNVKGKNPFKDVRVRKAFYQAIDIEAIKSKVMRNMAVPSAILITPLLYKRAAEFKRLPLDVEGAKKLLADAGYPQGFEVGMHCPNDRYVNDEAICQASAAMLARIGIKVNLMAEPKAIYFGRAGSAGGFATSFGLLGWTSGSFESSNITTNLMGCRDAKGSTGPFNYGGYCNPKNDELSRQLLVEGDLAKRDELTAQIFKAAIDDVSHIPLHQQSLSWGVSKKLKIVQRADDQFLFYWANKEP